MSHLAQSEESLWASVIAGLEAEGSAFDSLSVSLPAYLATSLGEADAYKTKSVAQMLAELNSHFGGATVSHLTTGFADLLSTLDTTLDGGGGLPEWLPEGAVFHADFREGNYWAGEEEKAVAALFDGTFDPSYVTGAGYLGVDTPFYVDDAADAFGSLTGFTLVVHGEFGSSDNIVKLLAIEGNEEFGVYTNDPAGISAYSNSPEINGDNPWTNGSEGKIAFTVNPTKMSLSDRGDTTDTVALTNEFPASGLGCEMPFNMLIYSMTVYPVQDDAALPALSALD